MSLHVDGRELHLINFFDPYLQCDASTAHPTPESLPQFAQYTYDLSPSILRQGHRRPPIINVLRYAATSPNGFPYNVEQLIFGGEWRCPMEERKHHLHQAKVYWGQRLDVRPDEVDIRPEDPRPIEVQCAEDAKAMSGNNRRGSFRSGNGKKGKGRKALTSKKARKATAATASSSLSGASAYSGDEEESKSEARDCGESVETRWYSSSDNLLRPFQNVIRRHSTLDGRAARRHSPLGRPSSSSSNPTLVENDEFYLTSPSSTSTNFSSPPMSSSFAYSSDTSTLPPSPSSSHLSHSRPSSSYSITSVDFGGLWGGLQQQQLNNLPNSGSLAYPSSSPASFDPLVPFFPPSSVSRWVVQ